MSPWQINVCIIGGTFLLTYFSPTKYTDLIMGLVLFGSTIWVYQDSKKIGIEKYKKTWLTPSTTAGGTAGIVFFIWIIAFPMYISWRYKAMNGLIPLKEKVIISQ